LPAAIFFRGDRLHNSKDSHRWRKLPDPWSCSRHQAGVGGRPAQKQVAASQSEAATYASNLKLPRNHTLPVEVLRDRTTTVLVQLYAKIGKNNGNASFDGKMQPKGELSV
jgi:hypothetical protein